MSSKRISYQINRLLDEAEEAVQNGQWMTAYRRASAVLVFEPENQDAKAYVEAAKRGLAIGIDIYPVLSNPPTILEPKVDIRADPSDALYYSISGGDLVPGWHGHAEYVVPWYIHGTIARFGLREYGGSMYAGVHLPHGAQLWGWRAYARRNINANQTTSVSVTLEEYDPVAHEVNRLGFPQTAAFEPGSTTDIKVISQTNLDHVIDNSKKTYHIDVSFSASEGEGQRSWFAGAVIIYRKPE